MFNNKQTNFSMQSVSGFPQNQTNTQFPIPSMSSFPQTQNHTTTSFPQTHFQVPSGFPIATNTEYNIYSIIEKKFINMKTLSIFTQPQDMKPSDLDIINNISIESIEKLGEQSILYIKNNNNKTKLNNIFEKNLELITKIIKFNNIYSEISLNIKQLSSLELTYDQKNFTFTDIFSRYKLQLYEIIVDIQMLIAYKTLITLN